MTSTNGDPRTLSFVDTNVFIYALVPSDPKSAIAKGLIDRLGSHEVLCVSPQVLQEVYVVSTRKLANPLTPPQAKAYVDEIAQHRIAPTGYPEIRDAIALSIEHSFSFWDSLLLISASRAGAKRLYTEDLQHGRVWNGIEVVNPFLEA